MIQWQHIEDSIRNKEKRLLKSQKLYKNLCVCVCVCVCERERILSELTKDFKKF